MAFNVSYIFQARDQFSAVADKVKRSTSSLRNKTKALGRQLNVVGRQFTNNFKTKATRALTAAKRKMDSLSASSKKLSGNLRNVGVKLTAFATIPIALFAKSFITAASNAEETRSKFNTVFGDIRSQANITSDNLAKNFGLSGTKARELIGDTGDLLTGFGFTTKSALDLSTQVNELAVDLASFTNFSGGAEGASRALTKALLGERESIKSLGISILDVDVKARVKQLVTVDKMKFASLRQAKAVATLQLAIEQSKNAIGDFNRTSDSYANKVRIMDARTQDLRESMGNILLPIAVKVVEAITSLTQKFTNLSPITKKIILIVAGILAVLGPLLLIIAGISAAIPFMIAGLSGIAVGIAFLFSPIGLVIAAIVLLASVVFGNFAAINLFIVDTVESIVNTFNAMSQGISLAIAGAIDFIVEKFQFLSKGAETVAKFIGSIFGDQIKKVDTITEKVKKIKPADISIGGFSEKKVLAENLIKTQSVSALSSVASNAELTARSEVQADIDIKISDPGGVVESVKTSRKGNTSNMNLGVNMQSAA